MSYTINWEPTGVYKQFSGQVAVAEFMESTAIVQEDARFASVRYAINDFSNATFVSVDFVEFFRNVFVAELSANSKNENVRLIVITNDEHLTMLLRTYTNMPTTLYAVKVFSDLVEARRFLEGIPATTRG